MWTSLLFFDTYLKMHLLIAAFHGVISMLWLLLKQVYKVNRQEASLYVAPNYHANAVFFFMAQLLLKIEDIL